MLFTNGIEPIVHLAINATNPEDMVYIAVKGRFVKWNEHQLWINKLGLKSQLSHQKAK